MDWTTLVNNGMHKLSELVTQCGKPTIDLAAQITQINGIGNLINGGFCVLVTLICFFVVKWSSRVAARLDDADDDHAVIYFILTPTSITIGIFTLIISIFTLLDIWNWVDALYPHLGLAHHVYQAVMDVAQKTAGS